MNKLKNILFFMGFVFLLFGGVAWAQEFSNEQIQKGLGEARAMQARIENECRQDPYTCSCDAIPCEDILQTDHPRTQEAYARCAQEKTGCESKRQGAIQEIEAAKSRIESACRANLEACDCSSVANPEGKKQCELAIIQAKYQAEKEKQDKIKECTEDLDNCSCSDVSDSGGRSQCEAKVAEARAFKAKIKAACEEDPINCDCSEIENSQGRAQCEQGKEQGMQEAQSKVKEALSQCFKNVDECVCSNLGLPEEKYVSFCEIQKSYGLSCRDEGVNCDKLENVHIYPPGMPAWLGKYFAKDYSSYIENEKAKGAKAAAGIIRQCVNNPSECQCEKTPTYARAFCEKNRDLQIKCEAGDYDACIILDETPNLPEGVPTFAVGLLDKLVGSLRSAKKNIVMGNAARKVGDMILNCMDSAAGCDCSLAPSGPIKSFCEHKKSLVNLCREKKQYESCFALDEEEVFPVQTPGVIKNYLQSNILSKINEKKKNIFNEMKQGTVCGGIATLEECKSVYQEQ